MRLRSDPGPVVGHRDDFRAERAHPIELGLRRGLDSDHRAGYAKGARGISHTLSRISGTDGPYAFGARFVRKVGDCIGAAADLVGIRRLQVLELEPDVGPVGTQIELDQWSPEDRPFDPLTRLLDVAD